MNVAVVVIACAAALVLLALLLWCYRGRAAVMGTVLRRPEKEPVDVLTARLGTVTDRLETATKQLQATVESLRTGAPPRDNSRGAEPDRR